MSAEQPIPSIDQGKASGDTRPIVVVDDEQSILELIGDILEAEGFTVLTARSGAAALRIIERAPVALVLTDLMMPQISGIELARKLRADPQTATIPLILMSAAMPADVDQLFTALLPKPFPVTRIVQVVRECLPA